MGDFNYRISLPGEEVKKAIQAQLFAQLAPNDQLTQQKAMGMVFEDFHEGPLNFAPTYKYDTFSDDYDTSEKCRVPAWTDRIFYKYSNRSIVHLLRYGRAELKTSDHRPVSALFKIVVWKLNPAKCEVVYNDIIGCMGPPDATVLVSVEGTSAFPVSLYYPVLEKLTLLGITPTLTKFEDKDLWLILENGEMALAALSMDGLNVDSWTLHVRLRTPEWTNLDFLQIKKVLINKVDSAQKALFPSMNGGYHFDIEDDEEDFTYSQNCTSPRSIHSDNEVEENFAMLHVNGVFNTRSSKPTVSPLMHLSHNAPEHMISSHPSDPCMQSIDHQLTVPVPPRPASSSELCSSSIMDSRDRTGGCGSFMGSNNFAVGPSDVTPAIPPRPKIIFR